MKWDFASSWALYSEEKNLVTRKTVETQCVVLRADVFSEPSELLLQFTIFRCCNLGGQGEPCSWPLQLEGIDLTFS